MTPPKIGATQNSHSWLKARGPPNTALPRLRAGLTEAFETGMAMMWMAVRARPMAIGAKPAGARFDVAPMMTIRKNAVSTVSIRNTDSRPERSIDSESWRWAATAGGALPMT